MLIIFLVIASAVLTASLYAIYQLFINNDLNAANVYSQAASGLGTVLLVGITLVYAIETRSMAKEMKREREFRQENIEGLQKSLYAEVSSIRRAIEALISTNAVDTPTDPMILSDKFRYLTQDDILTEEVDDKRFKQDVDVMIPTTVFYSNSDKVGQLDPELVAVLLRFYGQVDRLKNLISKSETKQESELNELKKEIGEQAEQILINSEHLYEHLDEEHDVGVESL